MKLRFQEKNFDYEQAWRDASARDILEDLGSISEEEIKYYENLYYNSPKSQS